MNVKFEQNECDNISRLGIKSEEDFESGLKFEDIDIVMEESEGINDNLSLKNYMAKSERKLKIAKKPHFCSLGCGKKFGGQQSMRLHVSKACKMNPDITAKGGLISASFSLLNFIKKCAKLKFRYCGKDTQIEKTSHFFHLLSNVKKCLELFSNFCGLLRISGLHYLNVFHLF